MITLRHGGVVDLSCRVGEVALTAPVLTAAGTAGHGAELGAYLDLARLGAVVVKSLAAGPWAGNAAPRVLGVDAGMLNSVGLQGPGVNAWRAGELPALEAAGATVVASIWGRSVAEYEQAAKALFDVSRCVVALEVNVSCPNLEDRGQMFAHSPGATAAAVRAARSSGLPCWVKLSPNTPDLEAIAAAALGAGAAALVLTNTLLGMAIDLETRHPALGAGGGGLSGPALHPVAVRAVYDCHRAFPDAPIIGVGGVRNGTDAIEFLLAGACAVEVGTATLADPRAPARVLAEIEQWCAAHEVLRVSALTGAAHADANGAGTSVGGSGR